MAWLGHFHDDSLAISFLRRQQLLPAANQFTHFPPAFKAAGLGIERLRKGSSRVQSIGWIDLDQIANASRRFRGLALSINEGLVSQLPTNEGIVLRAVVRKKLRPLRGFRFARLLVVGKMSDWLAWLALAT
jgi:hypothetical protein